MSLGVLYDGPEETVKDSLKIIVVATTIIFNESFTVSSGPSYNTPRLNA